MKKTNALDNGFGWSISDVVNGHNRGHEISDYMQIMSTNIAQMESVKGGDNQVRLFLSLRDASNEDITVTVSKESEIVATSWRPPFIKAETEANVEGNIVDVALEGKNIGWGSARIRAKAMMWSGSELDVESWDLGPLAPLGDISLKKRVVLEEGRTPHRVDLELDWGAGQQFYTIWDNNSPKTTSLSLISGGLFSSTVGMILAVAVLWITVPALYVSIRRRK